MQKRINEHFDIEKIVESKEDVWLCEICNDIRDNLIFNKDIKVLSFGDIVYTKSKKLLLIFNIITTEIDNVHKLINKPIESVFIGAILEHNLSERKYAADNSVMLEPNDWSGRFSIMLEMFNTTMFYESDVVAFVGKLTDKRLLNAVKMPTDGIVLSSEYENHMALKIIKSSYLKTEFEKDLTEHSVENYPHIL